MYFRFLPPPEVREEQDEQKTNEVGFSVLELSGVEVKEQKATCAEEMPPVQAPLQGIGCSPTTADAYAHMGSSGSGYLINTSQQHPGPAVSHLFDCQPNVTADDFCSFVDQNPVLETAPSQNNEELAQDTPQIILDDFPAAAHDEISAAAIQDGTTETEINTTKIVEFAKESQEFLSFKRKIGVVEAEEAHEEKRPKVSSAAADRIPLSTTVISPTPHELQTHQKSAASELEVLPCGQETLSLGQNELTGVSNLTCEILVHLEVPTPPSAAPFNATIIQSSDVQLQRYVMSESQDLNHVYRGDSIVEDSLNEGNLAKEEDSSEESVSDIEASPSNLKDNIVKDSASEKSLPELNKNHGPSNLAPFAMSPKTKSFSNFSKKRLNTIPAAVIEHVFSGHSSSTEPDNSNDEDYHPTQRSPKPLLPSPTEKKPRTPGTNPKNNGKRTVTSSLKKVVVSAASSNRNESSELGILSTSKKKKVKFSKQEQARKKILGGLRIMITISSKNSSDLPLSYPPWLLDKTKLQKKIRENGGVVVNDAWSCFQKDCRKIAKEVVLVTLTPLRTKKFLLALALGIPIISASWVSHCIEQGEYCDYNAFRLSNGDSLLLGQPCAALKASVGIFEGKSFLIYAGPSSNHDKETKDTVKDWEEILLACSATIVDKTTFKKMRADFVLVLVPALSDKELQVYGDWMCSTEYIIQCLRHQMSLSRHAHHLFTKGLIE